MKRLNLRLLPRLLILGLALLVFISPVVPAGAQTVAWKRPVKLYESDVLVDIPLLLSDAEGRVHLIWADRETNPDGTIAASTIFYMVNEDGDWSAPIDIIYRPNTLFSTLRGVVDPYGNLHLVYKGAEAALVYTRTLDTQYNAARSWTRPTHLTSSNQISVNIALDQQQRLHLIYNEASLPLENMVSNDFGKLWSTSRFIGSPPPLNQGITDPILRADTSGNLHMVWTLVPLPGGYPPLGSYYSRSVDGGQTWSQPVAVAPTDHTVKSLVAGEDGRVHILYIGRAGVGGRYHIISPDGGLTWSLPHQLASPDDGSGLSGGDMAMDQEGNVHAVFGLGGAEIVAYAQYSNGQWSRWEDIARGLTLHGEEMSIAITHGNRLHAVWRDNRNGTFAIWYAEGQTAGAEVQPVGFRPPPTATPVPQNTPTPENVGPTVPPTPRVHLEEVTSTTSTWVSLPLWVGGMTGIVIFAYAAFLGIRRRR